MRHLMFAVSILSTAIMSFGESVELNLEYQWKYIDFVWESENQKAEALQSGRYNASTIFLFDLDEAPDGRLFVTLIKDKGIPVSLATISELVGDGGYLLRPYPDWSWHTEDCQRITGGVYRIEIKCNYLFVVDAGQIGVDKICPPQLLIFDLATDRLVKRVLIPTDVARNKTDEGLLTSVYVYSQNCTNIKDNGIILMADTDASALVVYNPQIPKFCRIETEFMKPTEPTIFIEDQHFFVGDGIYSLSFFNKDLYFAALGGSKIYKMEISKVLTCTLGDDEASKKTQLVSTLPGQTATIASDDCVIFFNNIADYSILCADATKPNFKNNVEVVARDPTRLQFVSGLKIHYEFHELMVLSNRFQKHLTQTLDINEVNFHIFWLPMSNIKNSTKCFTGCSK